MDTYDIQKLMRIKSIYDIPHFHMLVISIIIVFFILSGCADRTAVELETNNYAPIEADEAGSGSGGHSGSEDTAIDTITDAQPPFILPGQDLHDETTSVFTSIVRIHPDMPEFTVTRTVNDHIYDDGFEFFPQPREVSIIIKDESGALIQEINGLTQSSQSANGGLSFDDYNFDGYLDMRLMRYQADAGGLLAQEYYWLWDESIMQFVLSEQLMEIGHSAWLTADRELRRIYVGNRRSNGNSQIEYEYRSGELVVVRRSFIQGFYTESGEILAVSADMRLLPGTAQNLNQYEVDIIVETLGDEVVVVQEIMGLYSSYNNPRLFSWQPEANSYNPLNFDIMELTGGQIILHLRFDPGGSLMNDPHYYWIWDSEKRQFSPHMELRELSDFGTITFGSYHSIDAGNVHSVSRQSEGLYIWRSYDLIDGELVLVQTKESVMDFDGENWRVMYIITDHVSGTVRTENEEE